MKEHTAILAQNHGEWILVTDDESERAWKDFNAAIEIMRLDGWQVIQGPAPIRFSTAGFERFEMWGYRLKVAIQENSFLGLPKLCLVLIAINSLK